ncbi:MAG: bifunctional tetrahydrofolate synthase/dihydrofolate synthase [Methylococcaceae bacterium]|nr:bifunctional tetrahydrofolate synthase/dihydrofolate synthase [Methylococcaceae bacterium]
MLFNTLAEWLAWQETLHPQAIDLGLSRVSRVLERMGPPAQQPFTISVGGTNGKGSCVAMLDSILRAAGYRTGTYTSPHILRYNERICIDGQSVGDDRIMQAFQRIDEARDGTSLSFFEFGTLAALEIFSEEAIDVRILEVGLGGRLDAVNMVNADIALIATIDIDHQEWLGHTREAIGHEKAGILRSGRPAVIADPDVPRSVIQTTEERGTRLYRQGQEYGFQLEGDTWSWWGDGHSLTGLPLPAIPGDHQLLNAAAVIQCLQLARDEKPVTDADVASGLTAVRLPGRFQFFPGDIPVLLDVAHNPQAVAILAGHLRQRFAGRKIRAIFSVMRDKDIAGMIQLISDAVDSWYLAPLQMPRAATPEELSEILHNAGIQRVKQGFSNVADACRAARDDADPDDLLLVFGSFFLVSDYLAHVA